MSKERVLKLGIAGFPYGGNGSTSSEVPDIRHWMAKVMLRAAADRRIDPDIWIKDFSDTPITMTRNRAVVEAKQAGVDVLIMVDSDMRPDCELGSDPEAKPFFETSFDFIYKHWDKGPAVVCAPYCGPPPYENVYVFYWSTSETDGQNIVHKLEMYPRETAAVMKDIQPCAAQPTGLIMFDMRAFNLTDPKTLGTKDGWFYYEWADCYAAEKCSTEDVTATRDISMHGILELGYSPIYCNWDAWAGHYKPKCVRKPRVIFVDQIGDKYKNAVLRNAQSNMRRTHFSSNLPAKEEVQKKITFDLGENVVVTETAKDGTSASVCYRACKPREDNLVRVGEMFTPDIDLAAIEKVARIAGETTKYRPLFLEVGSWVGESALAMLRGCPGAHVTCVDTWKGTDGDMTGELAAKHGDDVWKAFCENTKGQQISAMPGKSVEIAKSWGPGATPRDLIFIDAEHTYEALKADIEAWWPHLKDGGIMAFHDYRTSQFPGVTQAIHERFGEANVHWDGRTPVCWVKKNASAT